MMVNIHAIKTHKITTEDKDILGILDQYLPALKEGCIVAITSKIVSICEGNAVPVEGTDKLDLIKKEADLFLPPDTNKYNYTLTVKNNTLIPAAGIDKSNGNGLYILWPKNSQKSANAIRKHLEQKHKVKHIGVVITDSTTKPLRRGVTGISIAHSGFRGIKDYRGKSDVFGDVMSISTVHVPDALAASAVICMGEGEEQTPLAIIEDVSFVDFEQHDPTNEELQEMAIKPEEDVYGVFFSHIDWQK